MRSQHRPSSVLADSNNCPEDFIRKGGFAVMSLCAHRDIGKFLEPRKYLAMIGLGVAIAGALHFKHAFLFFFGLPLLWL